MILKENVTVKGNLVLVTLCFPRSFRKLVLFSSLFLQCFQPVLWQDANELSPPGV